MGRIEPFEKFADQYEDWFEKNYWVYQSELEAIQQQLPKGGKGIEIGVGSGRFAQPLGIKFGIEPSSRMREFARGRGIEVIDACAENLPFEASSFDFALMVTTICFLDDIEKAFRETYRILKLNGRLIIGFVNKDSSLGKVYQQNKNKSIFYKSARFFSVEEVEFYLKDAGFKEFIFSQTIFHDLREIKDIEPIKSGYGDGSFVVINARKD